MLTRYAVDTGPDGSMAIGPGIEDWPCDLCGGESRGAVCPGDGRRHHHGGIHTADGRLIATCRDCLAVFDAAWAAKRGMRPATYRRILDQQ